MTKFLIQLRNKQLELTSRIKVGDTHVAALMTSSNILDREKESSQFILAMHAELSELLEWTNWKQHKKTRVEYTPERLKEIRIELIDILHYWMNLCIIWDLTPENIVRIYEEKNKENHERQNKSY
jgi:NTP pyrophosphatase (non-canonical NTP hydrolase)